MNVAKPVMKQMEELQIIVHEIEVKGVGATKHICNSRRMLVSYHKVNEPEPMFMGNGTASKIERKWKVILKLTSEKDLVLSNVFHVPNITKNMISGPVDICNHTIIKSTEAEFFKNTFPYNDEDKQFSNPRKRILDDELSQDQRDNTSDVPQEIAKPKRRASKKIDGDLLVISLDSQSISEDGKPLIKFLDGKLMNSM
nr:putative RNA-directed DNA polymerase [Tanacetum cinerariifolium]